MTIVIPDWAFWLIWASLMVQIVIDLVKIYYLRRRR